MRGLAKFQVASSPVFTFKPYPSLGTTSDAQSPDCPRLHTGLCIVRNLNQQSPKPILWSGQLHSCFFQEPMCGVLTVITYDCYTLKPTHPCCPWQLWEATYLSVQCKFILLASTLGQFVSRTIVNLLELKKSVWHHKRLVSKEIST